jgi:hypothetical protein
MYEHGVQASEPSPLLILAASQVALATSSLLHQTRHLT